jgi:chemotaxis protein MotB
LLAETDIEIMRSSSYLGSVSDLMAGLMIVFLFIAISYMVAVKSQEEAVREKATETERVLVEYKKAKEETDTLNEELEQQRGMLVKTNETIKEIAASYSEIQSALHAELAKEFAKDLARWNATLERDNSIRFNEPEVLFLVGQAEIRSRFTEILDDFFPRYLEILYSERFRNEIDEIRIEGHTSSLWKDAVSETERYLKNANLSQQRALAVLSYCFQLPKCSPKRSLLIRDMRANGLSFARPVLTDGGEEDPQRSQRVEFRVVTKTQERILRILDAGNEKEDQE